MDAERGHPDGIADIRVGEARSLMNLWNSSRVGCGIGLSPAYGSASAIMRQLPSRNGKVAKAPAGPKNRCHSSAGSSQRIFASRSA
jgi:hypothetical protein